VLKDLVTRRPRGELVAREPPRRREAADELSLVDREHVQREVELQEPARGRVTGEVPRPRVPLVGGGDARDTPDDGHPRRRPGISLRRLGIVHEQ
jgi:hypothetical protein